MLELASQKATDPRPTSARVALCSRASFELVGPNDYRPALIGEVADYSVSRVWSVPLYADASVRK